jgi:endonuclease/exonuclease/phosphatase family metal-dependent hydrolase
MGELIRSAAPDVMGTQEGLYQQLQELATDLPGYAWTGVGRDGGTNGEFMAVFYRKDRLQPLATNHFWLSDTPDTVATASWGNKLNRMVTWLKFLDRETKREFYFFNTHFDHQSQVSREKSAELLRQRVSALPEKLPVVLTGDFNAISGKNKTYEILLREDFFKDTWHLAKTRKAEEYNSFTAFKEPGKEGLRIDWIFVRGNASVDSTEILPFSRNGQFPSDHFPVVARLTFGN